MRIVCIWCGEAIYHCTAFIKHLQLFSEHIQVIKRVCVVKIKTYCYYKPPTFNALWLLNPTKLLTGNSSPVFELLLINVKNIKSHLIILFLFPDITVVCIERFSFRVACSMLVIISKWLLIIFFLYICVASRLD